MKNKEERGVEGFHLHQKIASNEQQRRVLLMENIKYLHKVFKDKLYKEVLGDDKAEWVNYLAQIEIFYTRSKIYSYLKVYKDLVLKHEIEFSEIVDIPISRLMDLVRIEKKIKDLKEWLGKAKLLTSRDWRIEVREVLGLPTSDNCDHKWQPYQICRICGEKMKV